LVADSSGSQVTIGGPRLRTLLAALLLHASIPVSADELAEIVWDGSPPSGAISTLRSYVRRLRRALGDDAARIVARGPGYLIRVNQAELDTLEFEALCRDTRAALRADEWANASAAAVRALRLWRAMPLLDVPAEALRGEFVPRLQRLRLQVLEDRFDAGLRLGQHQELVPQLLDMTAQHPLQERFHAQLMLALASTGRRAQALRAYQEARRLIVDELGIEPCPEMRDIQRQILAGEAVEMARSADDTQVGEAPGSTVTGALTGFADELTAEAPAQALTRPAGPAVARPTQLPADIADFTGRGTQVDHLYDALTRHAASGPGAVRVAVVAGSAGFGKTTLAVHVAHQVRDRFLDGQLYVHLTGASGEPAAPGEVLAMFLRDLGVDGDKIPAGDEQRAALYRTRLSGRRVLILLDDAQDAAQVRPLLPGSASCAVLVTTRNRTPNLLSTRFVDLGMLPEPESLELFSSIVGDARPAAEPEATAEILRACAGLPLAIRICAARLATRRQWRIATMANRLRDERRRLDELHIGDLEVRASFQVSYDSLRPAKHGVNPARAFRLLGLWQGPTISLPAAAALIGEAESDVADALETLVDVNLLESLTADRYQFHDLLRIYAAERVVAEESHESRATALRRLYLWYLHTMDAAAQAISPSRYRQPLTPSPESRPLAFADPYAAFDWCEAERENLVAATRQAAADSVDDVAWQLPAATMAFYNRRGYRSDWITTHLLALDSVRQLQMRWGEAVTLNNLGMAYQDLEMETAVGYLEQALAIRREIGDVLGVAQTANNLLDTYLRWKRFAEVVEARDELLPKQRQAGYPYGEAIALNNVGEAYLGLGNVDDAIACLGEAREIFRDLGEARGEAFTMMNLGAAYLELKQPDQGVEHLRQAVALHHAVQERRGEATALKRLGDAYFSNGYPTKAHESLTRACAIFEDLGDDSQATAIRVELQRQVP
jgi:DNA-binding SARP family transcriptional activator